MLIDPDAKFNIDDVDEYLEYAWMEIGDVRKLAFTNKMLGADWEESGVVADLIVQTCRDPQYLHFFTKYILNIDLLPYQSAILQVLWETPFPLFIASRGAAKSFLNAVYLITRAVLHQGCKIAVVGASFRQSMVIFNYVQQIWDNAPILRDLCGGKHSSPKRDIHMAYWEPGHSKMIFLPLGSGDKIRGQRANIIACDEIASVPKGIFDTVVLGFAATKSDGGFDSVKNAYKHYAMEKQTVLISESDEKQFKIPTMLGSNQILMSGTAYYTFNHIYDYYRQYTAIIKSGGDPEIIKELYPEFVLNDDKLRPEDYAVIRLPYDRLPKGMMDDKILAQGRLLMDETIFKMEYFCCFNQDSDGFYLASSLNAATCPVNIDGKIYSFSCKLVGDPDKIYVMGIDPASEEDNFAIAIIEMDEDKNKVVYVWTTNKKDFDAAKKDGVLDKSIDDYHTFCIKHIRDLIRRFNIQLIKCDAGGGGVHIREGLRDADKMAPGDEKIILINNEEEKGKKILSMVEFNSAVWRRESHYQLRKDIVERKTLFPEYNAAELAVYEAQDNLFNNRYDTIGDCYSEINELKIETSMIKHSQTQGGTERWDVPRISTVDSENNKKKLKKDRFTALLLANWAAYYYVNNKNREYQTSSWNYHSVKRDAGIQLGSNQIVAVNKVVGQDGRKIYTGF